MYMKYGRNIPSASNWSPIDSRKYNDAWVMREAKDSNMGWIEYGQKTLTFSNMRDFGHLIDKTLYNGTYVLSDNFISNILCQ